MPDGHAPHARQGTDGGRTAAARPACAIVFTTDRGYLFPTLIAAMQARRFAAPAKADVLICHVGVDGAALDLFAAICAAEALRLVAIDPRALDGAAAITARLLLNRFMPDQYAHYLYIDGDVQIAQPLDPLIDAEVPAGHFLAANDPLTFMFPEHGDLGGDLARHTRAIGLTPGQARAYFNTGVLRISRAGWDETGTRAWRLIRDDPGRFRFIDQDPLNIVAQDRRLAMSLAWNFPIFMRNARVEAKIAPRITHFMSAPKPWQGAFAPWGPAAVRPYLDALEKYPALGPYNPAFSLRRRARYQVQQLAKMAVETCQWGLSDRRRRILRYEARIKLLEQSRVSR
jgi:hypothetical protein